MKTLFLLLTSLFLNFSLMANDLSSDYELNPFDADIENQLKELDRDYKKTTGENPLSERNSRSAKCQGKECAIYIEINKTKQQVKIYIDGDKEYKWKVSTGLPKYETPKFNKNPDGRMYKAYTSTKYPGGDYQGLGNMPYAIFISGGFAIHGTPKGNWPLLGQKASHGCIRIHPDNAKILYDLVKQYGISDTWFSIID
jgi:lipoprotein-anchoring transpeptidase ErfK/SrfK